VLGKEVSLPSAVELALGKEFWEENNFFPEEILWQAPSSWPSAKNFRRKIIFFRRNSLPSACWAALGKAGGSGLCPALPMVALDKEVLKFILFLFFNLAIKHHIYHHI